MAISFQYFKRRYTGQKKWRAIVISTLAFSTCPHLVMASDLSQICDHAALVASQQTGVPVSVLRAISLTETGKKQNGKMRPWPWTVNMEGKGVWFESEDDARAYVFKHFKRGARSFDVGCFQINYKWHGQAFSSIEEMFEPIPNALYAASFLKDLYAEKQDWTEAAGAYHSRTPKYAKKYKKIFETYHARVVNSEASDLPKIQLASTEPIDIPSFPEATPEPIVKVNRYPLLQANGTNGSLGSLVSLSSSTSRAPFIQPTHSGDS